MTRELEHAADQGDEEARYALGAQRAKKRRCPWCSVLEPEETEDRPPGWACCCGPCFAERCPQPQWSLRTACPGCPAKHIDDEQSKEDM